MNHGVITYTPCGDDTAVTSSINNNRSCR